MHLAFVSVSHFTVNFWTHTDAHIHTQTGSDSPLHAQTNRADHVHVHEGEETQHTPKHTCQRQLSPGDTPRESCSYCQHTGWELCHSSLAITVTSSSALFPNHCSCSANGQIWLWHTEHRTCRKTPMWHGILQVPRNPEERLLIENSICRHASCLRWREVFCARVSFKDTCTKRLAINIMQTTTGLKSTEVNINVLCTAVPQRK